MDEASTLPYLLELLGVKDSGIEKISLSPEAKKERMIETVKGSAQRVWISPLILAVEDLHWVDKTSEEVMKYLLESMPGPGCPDIHLPADFVRTWAAGDITPR